jgi:hypothetical protein
MKNALAKARREHRINRRQLKHPERIRNANSGKISFSLFSNFRDILGYIENKFVSLSLNTGDVR